MRRPSRVLLPLLLVALLAACRGAPTGGAPAPVVQPVAPGTSPTSPASQGRLQQVKVGFANITAMHSALWAAQESGAFARNGLDVDLANLGKSQVTQAALVSRQVVVASVSGSSSVNVRLAGGDLVIVGAVFDTMPYQLATARDITALTDLRGKKIGVNSFGGAADSILRYLLRQAGVDPERETTILQVGAQDERVAALKSGAIQASLVDPPFASIADKEGLRVLLDTADLGIAYPQDSLVMSRGWLAGNRDTGRRILQSLADGNRAFRTDHDLGIRTLKRWLQLDDPAMLEETYAYFSRALPDDLLPRPEGIQLVIDEVAADHPEARSLRPEDLLDSTLASEVQ